jgi:HK97 family phage major capsid protein
MGHIKSAKTLVDEVQRIYERADLSKRDLTQSERTEVEGLLLDAKAQKGIEDLGRELGGGFSTLMQTGAGQPSGSSPGEAFVMSEGYKAIKSAGSRGQSWTSGLVDVGFSMKGTLLEGAGSPGSGSGGGLLPVPQVVPGVVETLFQPLSFERLLLSGVATGNQVRYGVEGTATSGAAGVAEAGLKPESTLGYGVADEPIRKVATSLQISDELLEDAPAIQQFVNGRLSLFVSIEVERQLFRGTAGGNEVQGILTSRGVPVYAGGTAAGNRAVQLFKAMNGTRGSSFTEPEWVVIHPTDWEAIRLTTDTAGQLMGGGPFMGPYGNGANTPASGQITGAADSLWGKAVYVTSAIGGAGTALVGSTAAAQVWSRGGLRVEATNSHASNFVLDITAIRAERRLGLTVYRPDALCEVRLG